MSRVFKCAALVLCIGSLVSTASAASLVGERKAIEAALAHAAVKAEDAAVAAFSLVDRGGRAVYDIIFDSAQMGYHYVVDAESGEVIDSSSHERKPIAPDAVSSATGKVRPTAPANGSSVYDGEHIGAERAKQIAIDHAGVSESDIRKLKIKKDREYGRTVYEVEFKLGEFEYDYDIDAATGEIVQWRKELD